MCRVCHILKDIPSADPVGTTICDQCTVRKSVVGCIPYLDSYVYFDRNGMFVEGDKTRDESVPYFEGIRGKKSCYE